MKQEPYNSENKPLGKLYGVGVGPGDPELVTFKAAKIISQVDVIFASAQKRSGRSLALEIASRFIPEGAEVDKLYFPHTFEGVENGLSHRVNAEKVLEVLGRPASAAFLTVGDPMTYSTFTYLLSAVLKFCPETPVEVVPGVTSFAAAAAAATTPLVEGNESLALVSGVRGTERVEEALGFSENIVILKPYRRTDELCDLLASRNLEESTIFSSECSRESAATSRGLSDARKKPHRYMSLFLVKNRTKGCP